ncbi:MAG: DNRLRE domain-containing protein [Kiritimatiellae bacterium]|jgi:hypothetical protein|nr:DNRLRE domain-containing protein [Kiritimatiellia bacterium]
MKLWWKACRAVLRAAYDQTARRTVLRFCLGLCKLSDARFGKCVLKPESRIPHLVFSMFALALFATVATAENHELRVRTTHSKLGVSGFVRGGNTGHFGGVDINLKNAGSVDNFARKGYIRMDISDVDFTIRSAYLDMVVCMTDIIYKNIDQTINVYGLTDESLDNWNPAETTWDNAPANDISSSSGVVTNSAVFLGEFTVAYEDAGTPKRFTSAALIDFLNADTNGKVTFILCRPDSIETFSGWNLLLAGDAHETYAPPKLTLTSEITTLSGTGGVSGQVSADDTGAFGIAGGWHLKNDADLLTKFTRKGYIRFDISSNDAAATNASLNVILLVVDDRHHYYGNNQTLFVYGLTDETLDIWDPSTTTWSNAPGNNTNSADRVDTETTTHLGEITVIPTDAEGTVKTLSGTALDNFLNADTNGKVTFIISREQNKGYKRDIKIVGDRDVRYSPPSLMMAPGK